MCDGVVAAFVVVAAGCAAVEAVGGPADAAGIDYHVGTPIAVVLSTCLVHAEGLPRVPLVDLSRIDWDEPKIHLGERAKAFHDNPDNVEGHHVSLDA